MKQGNEPDKPIKHIVEEGSRSHVVSWDSIGAHCSEPNCEINKPSDVDKQIDIKSRKQIDFEIVSELVCLYNAQANFRNVKEINIVKKELDALYCKKYEQEFKERYKHLRVPKYILGTDEARCGHPSIDKYEEVFQDIEQFIFDTDTRKDTHKNCIQTLKDFEKSIRAGVVEEVRELLKGVGKEIVVFMKINSDGLRFTEKGREYRWTDIEQILSKISKGENISRG